MVSSLVVSVSFFLFLFCLLSLIRFLHLLNVLFDHRIACASRSRGHDPDALLKSASSVGSAQWDALQAAAHSTVPRRTMVILGSGGHTAEMLCLLQHIDRRQCAPLIYVRAKTDISSEVRIRQMEIDHRNANHCEYLTIPRSREVGQSYLSSVFTTLVSIVHSIHLVYRHQPQILLCNGPGTCLPMIVSVWLMKLWLFRRCRVVFIESFCRVDGLSLCGVLVYPLVDRFIVQWPKLTRRWRLTEYCGRLC